MTYQRDLENIFFLYLLLFSHLTFLLRYPSCLLLPLTLSAFVILLLILSPIFEGIQTTKCPNQFFSTNVVFIKWKFSCMISEAETTLLWACANQVESMSGLFLDQDCIGLSQVTLQCVYNMECFVVNKAFHLSLLRDRKNPGF